MEGLFNIFVIFGVVVFCASFSASAESSPLVTRTSRTTLTTAQVSTGIPKPTSWHRRMNVVPVEKFSSAYDVFRVTEAQRRSHSHNVFEWDYYCQAQPRRGDCTVLRNKSPMTEKYYYDAQNDQCKTFTYSGCNGNKNNFRTKVECDRHCKGSSSMTLKNAPKSTYCTLQPSVGTCLGLIKRYYYNDSSNDCKTFLYGGCGGNQNRFNTYALCMSRCRGVK